MYIKRQTVRLEITETTTITVTHTGATLIEGVDDDATQIIQYDDAEVCVPECNLALIPPSRPGLEENE